MFYQVPEYVDLHRTVNQTIDVYRDTRLSEPYTRVVPGQQVILTGLFFNDERLMGMVQIIRPALGWIEESFVPNLPFQPDSYPLSDVREELPLLQNPVRYVKVLSPGENIEPFVYRVISPNRGLGEVIRIRNNRDPYPFRPGFKFELTGLVADVYGPRNHPSIAQVKLFPPFNVLGWVVRDLLTDKEPTASHRPYTATDEQAVI